jgi:hypothetical protein
MTLPIRLVPYATGYDLRIDYLTDRVPPLLPPDAVWADDLLRRCALSAEAGVYVNWGMSVNKIFDPAHEELSGFDDYDNVIDGVVQEDVPVIKGKRVSWGSLSVLSVCTAHFLSDPM